MRVALYNLTTTTRYGGVESFVWDLARELAARGHDVTIQGGRGPRREHAPGVRVETFPFLSRRLFQAFPLFKRAYAEAKLFERLSLAVTAIPALVRGRFDIIHLQKPYDIAPALLARRLSGARVILGCHGEDFYRGDRPLAHRVDAAVSCSHFNAHTVAARYGIEPEVVFNGIDPVLFAPQPRNAAERRAYCGGGDPAHVLLFVGRLQPWKGVETAIRALPLLDDTMLLIAGDGEDRARLEQITATLDLTPRVRFLGALPRTSLPSLFASADLLVATSFASETFGIALVEAQASGLPVVAARFGAFPDVVDEGRTGALFIPRDPADLARVAGELLAQPAHRARLAAAAPDWAAQFAWPIVAGHIEEVYRKTLESGTRAAQKGVSS